ncbi:serine/threonine-protein kinase 11-interacting protein [Scaptodrosophila lebanonensis]|uniref:Serine/threonine-protein kinase 11-interacting protein n=1 Tax=Drosophila lebanonensis TaxID=7225 RepID=A0A6J2TLJ7_DROLE|nr:serine/threonine-protein kinase 11-interacting protein [Scaptodrosophila lebanonensis]
MDPQKITELANLLRKNGDKILSSEFSLTLSGSLVRALNDSFTLIADTDIGTNQQTFQVVKSINATSHVFPDLQLLHDFVQKTTLLRIVYYPSEQCFTGAIDITKFRALKRLEVQKINIMQLVGIKALRSQLQHLICVKSLRSVEDIITHCGGDNSNGFVWNELRTADFSFNNLQTVDTSLEFAQNLQHLSLRHNKLHSATAIKWLPHLKTLDLSYNCLTTIPQFHMEACKRLEQLNISNNYVEDLLVLTKMNSLWELDLSDNCLLDHSQLLPLSAIQNLQVLKLYGNPLHCHPKHRLATAQYLHKDAVTLKFLLDLEPLSKAEKALTGSQRLSYMAIRHSTHDRSLPISVSGTPTSANTPASSVDSRRTVNQLDSSSGTEQGSGQEGTRVSKRRLKKERTVDIEEHDGTPIETAAALETKKQIEKLHSKSEDQTPDLNASFYSEEERLKSRQLLNDFLSEFAPANTSEEVEPQNMTSTPTNESVLSAPIDATLTPIKITNETNSTNVSSNAAEETTYESCNTSMDTHYESLAQNSTAATEEQLTIKEEQAHEHDPLHNIYERNTNALAQDESDVSEAEPDEETYIVHSEAKPAEPLFLTISSNFLREKDALSDRTKAKWSLSILESCERIKSNMLRINFDTIRKDKKERIYCIENSLCQEVEKKLRDILSQRDLSAMNIVIYRCVSCNSKFMRENKQNQYRAEAPRCPDCGSTFIAEVQDESSSLDKPSGKNSSVAAAQWQPSPNLSPALIVEESPVGTPLVVQRNEENNSIVTTTRLTANNTPKRRTLTQTTKSSANSLNESSSCSKITNSQCSFDSNQSVVGSSNTERDLEFRANESDVDIISNPSQSSIEVLDPNCAQTSSRKTSEERRISQIPHLQTIDDVGTNTQSFIDREFGAMLAEQAAAVAFTSNQEATPKVKSLAHVQLTESSSSGSVTDSICTAYDQQATKEKQPQQKQQAQPTGDDIVLQNMLLSEPINNNNNNNPELSGSNANGSAKKEDAGLSSRFGALFQSTNLLMSSSKKLIEAEAAPVTNLSQPYKFNYTNFNDIDHRLKLYFYQSKFEENGEHFKWLARGRIYNEQTQVLCDGLVVMSTCKCYLMEAFAPPHDDVTKWLRQVISVTMDRLESVQVLPWKMGLSFALRDWGSFLLLLQDIIRTDSLLLYFANATLPTQCELKHSPAENVVQRLSKAADSKLTMCALLNGCVWTCEGEKRNFDFCALLTTDSHLYLGSASKCNWLSASHSDEVEICLTQLMNNLVDVESVDDTEYKINFLDETQNKTELWHLKFATKDNAECCLNAIGQSWEQLFGVRLLSA